MAAGVVSNLALPSTRVSQWAALRARVDPVLALLLAVGLWARAFRLSKPGGALIFDEAYYVQDARVILGQVVTLDHLPAHTMSGLDPNSEHPPLAKLIMAAAMHLFPRQDAAWRIPSVILGVLSI